MNGGANAGEETVRSALDSVLRSPPFAASPKLKDFLRYCVERTLEGRGDEIKEYSIGHEVYGRNKHFDPQIDSIVRVEAARLRRKLAEYYEGAGRNDGLRIDLPKGGYVPEFRAIPAAPPASAKHLMRPWAAGAIAILSVAATIAAVRLTVGRSGGPTARSVAVLPFSDLTATKDRGYLCDGLADDIIDRLSRVPGMLVVARNSSFRFKGQAADIREVGRQLRVRRILEGSVRAAGDRLRISAQLVDASSGYRLWSSTYERQLRDLPSLRDEISRSVAESLSLRLAGGDKPRRAPKPEAYDLYLRGRYYSRLGTLADDDRARELFEQAVAKDPEYAEPYAGLADAYSTLAQHGAMPAAESLVRARPLARKALELDPDSMEAHLAMARIARMLQHDHREAEQYSRKAIALNPGASRPHNVYGLVLEVSGRLAEAVKEYGEASRLDPASSQVKANQAMALYDLRQYAQAVSAARESIALSPQSYAGYIPLVAAQIEMGAVQEAARNVQRLRPTEADAMNASRRSFYAAALARLGRSAEARGELAVLLRSSEERYVSPATIAQVYLALREFDRAEEYLEEAYEKSDPLLWRLHQTPAADPLRTRPRYRELARKLNTEANQ